MNRNHGQAFVVAAVVALLATADVLARAQAGVTSGGPLGVPVTFGATFLVTDAGEFAAANGAGLAVSLVSGTDSEAACPVAGSAAALAWSTAAADVTTVIKLHLNGGLAATVTLSGADGAASFAPFVVAAGERLQLEFDAGTAPGISTWSVLVR